MTDTVKRAGAQSETPGSWAEDPSSQPPEKLALEAVDAGSAASNPFTRYDEESTTLASASPMICVIAGNHHSCYDLGGCPPFDQPTPAPQGEAQPVADEPAIWMAEYHDEHGRRDKPRLIHHPREIDALGGGNWIVTPLYAHPSPAPEAGDLISRDDLADLIERLEYGVCPCGMHDDNSTELYMIDDANDTMAEAAAALRALPAPVSADHRSFPDAADGRTMPPMGDELMIAGLNGEDARFVAIQLAQNGLTLVPAHAVSAGTVKPLVWEMPDETACLGHGIGPCMYYLRLEGDCWWSPGDEDDAEEFDNLEAAKAAAQADYAARILSAIETPVSAWQGIDSAKPPKDRPFLARNPGFAAFIAEWSDVDEEYIHDSGVDGWICLYFSHWMEIPDLSPAPPSTKEGGEA